MSQPSVENDFMFPGKKQLLEIIVNIICGHLWLSRSQQQCRMTTTNKDDSLEMSTESGVLQMLRKAS